MAVRAVDLDGIPEKQADAIEEQVRYWKRRANDLIREKSGELPLWKGTLIGRLTRDELYGDE